MHPEETESPEMSGSADRWSRPFLSPVSSFSVFLLLNVGEDWRGCAGRKWARITMASRDESAVSVKESRFFPGSSGLG